MEFILKPLFGAIAYRFRGGLWNEFIRKLLKKPTGWEIPNTICRLAWAIFVFVCILPVLPSAISGVVSFLLAFLGGAFGYFWADFDLSKDESLTRKNFTLLTLKGVMTALPLVAYLVYLGNFTSLHLLIASTTLVPAYLFGIKVSELPVIGKYQGHTQWGELIFGLILGFSLIFVK